MRGKHKKHSTAILSAATALCLSSAAVLAARKHFSPSDITDRNHGAALSESFHGSQALLTGEAQSPDGLDVTSPEIIPGENLSDYSYSGDRIYFAAPAAGDPLSAENCGNSERGVAVAQYALQFLGTPYLWGKDSLTEGTDCSGFVKSIYEHFGIFLPHSASLDRSEGFAVESLEDAKPGDLICYEEPSHVALYIGGGKILHASSTNGVCISEVEYAESAKVTAIRRLLTDEQE